MAYRRRIQMPPGTETGYREQGSLRSGRLLLLWKKISPGQHQASCTGKSSENILQMGQMEVARGIFQKDFSRTPTIQHFARGGAYSRKAMEQVHQTSAAGLL